MANETQLPQGQLNPAARPVDAFIQPVNYQVAQPGQPAQLPGVSGLQIINRGGGLNVAGENRFERLAQELSPFNKALTETLQTAGLQYASWQMQKGEAEFMAAYRKAQVAVDQQGEVGEGQYAKASRELYAKDNSAGWAMWLANPYRQMGAERARSRLAGQEIQYRMAGVEGQITAEDYEKPDQGFAKLQSLRAGVIAQVTESWGVNENSPGFQKYVAPAVEKAAEKSANNLIEDRRKYYDEMKPKQLAQLLKNAIILESRTGSFQYKGQTYTRGQVPEEAYWITYGTMLNDMSRDFLSKAGPAGMASKWSREAYGILSAEANFKDDQRLFGYIGQIKSSEPLRGADGKPVMDANGKPVYLTWAQLYQQEDIDSQIKYQQAGYQTRAGRSKDLAERGSAEMFLSLEKIPPGPEREMAAANAMNAFIGREEARLGRKLTPPELLQIRRQWVEDSKLNSNLLQLQADPEVELKYLASLEQQYGSSFDAARERARVTQLAAELAQYDPTRAQRFQATALQQIAQKEKEIQDSSGYTSSRDKVINDNIQARLRRNYEYLQGAADPKADREESERRQRLAYTALVNARIREKEAQLKRKLNDSEVRSVAQTAIDDYGKTDKDALEYLFPGSQAYPNTPSVDPFRTIKPVDMGPDGKPKPAQPAGGAKPIPVGPIKLYDTNQLDTIPNRSVVLRQFRAQPVMSLNAVRDVVFDAIDGKPLPKTFERAWRDAGARNAYEFLQEQLKFYPNYKPEWTDDQLRGFQKRSQASAGSENAAVATREIQAGMPMLASLQGWSFNDPNSAGYLKRLAYLETRIKNIPNAEGSPGRGFFQAFPKFNEEAIAASGGISPRDSNYDRSAQATWAWIKKHRPKAAEAIRRGNFDLADQILRPTWPSLPGGSQAQPAAVQRRARQYLPGWI